MIICSAITSRSWRDISPPHVLYPESRRKLVVCRPTFPNDECVDSLKGKTEASNYLDSLGLSDDLPTSIAS